MTAPATPVFNPGARIVQQPDQRRDDWFEDQHGRIWFATVEIKTGHPTGGLFPADGWTAPTTPAWCRGRLIPDQKYLKLERKGGRLEKVTIDYEQWVTDWMARYDEWRAELRDLAGHSAGSGKTAAEWIANPPKEVLDVVRYGPQAKTPLKLIRAMAKGNRWSLGLSDVMPEWAETTVDEWQGMQRSTPKMVLDDGEEFPDAEEIVPFADFEEDADPDAVGSQSGRKAPIVTKAKAKAAKVKETVRETASP